jgi:hypothetical protein
MDSANYLHRLSACHDSCTHDERLSRLSRIWAAMLLGLLAVTWRLWLGNSAYPAIPMMALPDTWQRPISLISLALIVVGCCGVVLLSSGGRLLWLLVSAGLLGSFVADQHRLQPWAYQSAVHGVLFALLSGHNARRWSIGFLASVYVYSALGKFDFQFVHTVGQDFLRPIFSATGLEDRLDVTWKVKLAFVLPGLELVGGLGAIFRQTRRAAGTLLVTMHVGLLVMLSPFGFNHSYGVLLWNVLLGIAACEMFVRHPVSNPTSSVRPYRPLERFAILLTSMAIAAPLVERSGYWDHWPSWALYSPHNSRVKLQVHSSALGSLPIGLTRNLTLNEGWVDIDLDAWSLESRGVPIYPQARYQLALATHLAKAYNLNNSIRCVVQSVSDRWNGQRDEKLLLGADEMQKLLQAFWLVPKN